MRQSLLSRRCKVAIGISTPTRFYSSHSSSSPIISIRNGTFYRHHPSSVSATSNNGATVQNNPVLFPELNFTLPSFSQSPEYWAVVGPSSSGKTTLLEVLHGKHICLPPTARSYPFLSTNPNPKGRISSRAIRYVGFSGDEGGMGGSGIRGAYLSARYESLREETDWSVLNYLKGNTELNPLEQTTDGEGIDSKSLQRVLVDLRLAELQDMPVSNLSNGQTRRARIAKALLDKPEVLLLDEPFMGLDPPTLMTLSPLLYGLAEANTPRLLLALRPQDPIPDWITHLMFLGGECKVALQGPKAEVLEGLESVLLGNTKEEDATARIALHSLQEVGRELNTEGITEPWIQRKATSVSFASPEKPSSKVALSRDGYPLNDTSDPEIGEALVEMEGARVAYGEKAVLGNWTQDVNGESKHGLWWTVRRGERWGIFGPNGSGKTTILSLICSDHPQTYSLPIKLFGRSRLPEPGQPGISVFDIQSRIGHSSPEIQSFMPRSLTLRKVLASAWAETFQSRPKLDDSAQSKIEACLRWFESELRPRNYTAPTSIGSKTDDVSWADDAIYGSMPFSAQRVALFLRAVIKHPDMVILDEAFSGMDEELRDKCLLFLAHGEQKTFRYSENAGGQREVVDSDIAKAGKVQVKGLNRDQALICISHVREEIPGCVREWICLPEANEGRPARFGRLDGPIEGNYRRWNEIWGM